MSTPAPRELSEVIGLIYDAATDLSLWPELLEGVSGYLQQLDDDAPRLDSRSAQGLVNRWFDQGTLLLESAATPQERQLMELLMPHIVRANAIHQNMAQAEEERDLLESALDRLPIGMAIVDRDGRVSGLNRALLEVTGLGGSLRLEQGRLIASPAGPLQAAIRETIDFPATGSRLLHLEPHSPDAISLLISRMALKGRTDASRAVVFVASRRTHRLSEQALVSAFGLTPAEARLTQALARGRTLDEIAQDHAVTIHTTRAQLKAVFAKTGVRRQPELMQLLYSSPVWLSSVAESTGEMASPIQKKPAGRPAEGLRLRDGRWLAFADVGRPGDLPVMLMHGISGSRLQRHPDDSLLEQCGVRLIMPERPGCGDSDPQPQRRIVDWPRDVAELADHLGLDRFAIAGFSGGTPYALAAAALLQDRVTSVTLVGCAPPFTGMQDVRHYLPAFRMAMLLARYAPNLLPPIMRVMVKGIRSDPERYIEQVKRQVTEADREVLDDPYLRKAYVEGLLASVRHDERELVLETLLSVQDWGFDLSEVRAPVTIWHGEDDRHVSVALAERIGKQLGAVALHRLPRAGHFVIYQQWQAIFSQVAAAERQGATESAA